MNEDALILLSKLYRDNFDKMVSVLMHHSGIKNIAIAEDIVQDAFAVASEKWKVKLPEQPTAWLFKTIRNLAYNKLRGDKRKVELEKEFVSLKQSYIEEGYLLKLLFICVQPSFSPKLQLIIALRYARGLQVKRIAVLLGTDEDAISKMLYRWRMQNHSLNWNFSGELDVYDNAKASMVLKILYVMFTEGYRLDEDGKLLDERLCEDALSLVGEMMKSNIIANGQTKALYALMLYQLARSCSRTNNCAELMSLKEQERACWDQELIAVANSYLSKSRKDSISENAFQIEAAIAYKHVSASSFEKTDWIKIAKLYEKLETFNHSPFVKLNRAVALYFGKETAACVNLLKALNENKFFRNYHLVHCFWGMIHYDQSDYKSARIAYHRALDCAQGQLEEKFIKRKLAEIPVGAGLAVEVAVTKKPYI